MYRAVIEHPEFMPPELKNRPDLTAGKDKGRIWRIVPKDHKTKTPRPGLSKASIADLVKTLEHEEPWWRTTAQRLLLEKNDKAMIEPLTKLLETTKSPHAKILAAWMLDRQGKIGEKELVRMCKDNNPRVRESGLRIAEIALARSGNRPPREILVMHDDQDSRVRFQLALLLGGISLDTGAACTLVEVASRNSPDRWSRLAATSALPQYAFTSLFAAYTFHPKETALIRETAFILAAQPDSTKDVAKSAQIMMKGDFPLSVKWACLLGLAEGLQRRGSSLSVAAEALPAEQRTMYQKDLQSIFDQAARNAADSKQTLGDRMTSIHIVTHATWATAKQALSPVIEKEPMQELRIAALRALAAQQDKEVPELLMKLWPGAGPSVRREILEAMLRQPARVHVLLDEIESRRMKASELDPLRTRQLSNHKDEKIRERARKLLADNVPADRQKALKNYQEALTLKGDARKGRDVFKANCATCHRVAGVGVDVGPDIADTRTKTETAMLFDIIVPNAAIDANYVNYVVSTKDGKILTGLLTAETGSSITLKRAENQVDVVLRKDIDEISSTGVSLMPDGLESKISVQEMADLLRFLKDWRYLDGSVPLKN
jgi:putative heme-binding domain-containing protein